MHAPPGMTILCQSGKHSDAGRESIPMYYSCREEAELIVIGRSTDLSVCQMDEFGLPIYDSVFCDRDLHSPGSTETCDVSPV